MEGATCVRAMQFALFIKTIILLLMLVMFVGVLEARGGRRTGKSKGKSNLQFAQVAEFSLVHTQLADSKVSLRRKYVFINYLIQLFQNFNNSFWRITTIVKLAVPLHISLLLLYNFNSLKYIKRRNMRFGIGRTWKASQFILSNWKQFEY